MRDQLNYSTLNYIPVQETRFIYQITHLANSLINLFVCINVKILLRSDLAIFGESAKLPMTRLESSNCGIR